MTNETYLEGCRRELGRLRRLAERALAQVSDEAFFASTGPESNSAAVIVKHVSGNMLSRWQGFLSSDGEAGRDRDAEFVITGADTREALERQWNQGWDTLFDVLGSLGESDLDRVVLVRREPHSVLQAIQRQLVHYACHVGQIVYVARLTAGENWQCLSIPKGQSAAVNERPGNYLGAGGPAR